MRSQSLRYLQRNRGLVGFLVLLTSTVPWVRAGAQATSERPYYDRVNSFGIISAYSPDSSHIILGVAENRKLWSFGVSYSRRLWASPRAIWHYDGELLPFALEGDPLTREIIHQTSPKVVTTVLDGGPGVSCAPVTGSFAFTDPNGVVYSGTVDAFCHGRQWTFGQAVSPLGLQWNFLPHRKIQPLFTAHVGYMYSTKPIPVSFAGSFNFTFDFGPGIEFYRTATRSFRAEYRYHHISNHNSASENPGIDNGLFQLAFVFGR